MAHFMSLLGSSKHVTRWRNEYISQLESQGRLLPAKPRLRLRRGIWVCSMPVVNPWNFPPAMGHGYTPDQAYQEWAAITRLALR